VLTSKRLIELLIADEDQPWATYNKGNPVSQRQVARLLGAYSIISETVHLAGEKDAKGYKLDRFHDAFESYLPPAKTSGSP
jgi:putative DNA primase/helicase